MKFKTQRIENEFYDSRLSKKIKEIVLDLEKYVKDKYGYEITLTEVFRHQVEQDDIYKTDLKYKEKPWRSTHQDWRAIDIRTNDILVHGMLDDMLNYVNKKYPYDLKRPDKKTCVYHDVGKGIHFHLQSM